MIRANELRSGNYLLYQNSFMKEPRQIQVDGYQIGQLEDWQRHTNNVSTAYKGVPLTEDLILRLGTVDEKGEWRQEFEETQNGLYTHRGADTLYMVVWESSTEFSFSVLDYETDSCAPLKDAKITHLHQLQNLYFALTGRDLTLQP